MARAREQNRCIAGKRQEAQLLLRWPILCIVHFLQLLTDLVAQTL